MARRIVFLIGISMSFWLPAQAQNEYQKDDASATSSPAPSVADPAELLRTFRAVYIHSDTVYMRTEVMQKAFEQQPEFGVWKLKTAKDRNEAEVGIEVTRPFLTFDWTYRMVAQRTGTVLGTGKVVAWDGNAAAPKLAAEIVNRIRTARPLPADADPARLLEEFRTVYLHSDTLYMKAETLQKALEQRQEYDAWGLVTVSEAKTAEVSIEITRPFLTFDWMYSIVDRKTGIVLGVGKVVAWDGNAAAPKLAAEIVNRIQTARPLPAAAAQKAQRGEAGSTSPLKGKKWRVKSSPGGTKLTLTINQETIFGQEKNSVLFSISVGSVVAVSHRENASEARNDPAKAWWGYWGDQISSANRGGPGSKELGGFILMGMPVILGVGAILEGVKAEHQREEHHFVRIDWLQDGAINAAIFEVPASKYQPLLTELQKVTQKQWKDLPEAIQRVRQELMREMPRSVSLQLDRAVRVGWSELPPGSYQLVLLEREAGRGELYFFSGQEASINKVAAQAMVKIEMLLATGKEVSGEKVSEIVYQEENGISSISVIHVGNKILRFTAVPLGNPENPAPPVVFSNGSA